MAFVPAAPVVLARRPPAPTPHRRLPSRHAARPTGRPRVLASGGAAGETPVGGDPPDGRAGRDGGGGGGGGGAGGGGGRRPPPPALGDANFVAGLADLVGQLEAGAAAAADVDAGEASAAADEVPDNETWASCDACGNTGFTPCAPCAGEGKVPMAGSEYVSFCGTCVGHGKVRCVVCGGRCYMCV